MTPASSALLLIFLAASAARGDAPPATSVVLPGRTHPEQHTVAFSPDARYLAAGGPGGAVKIWDAATGKEVRTMAGHNKNVFDVTFSPDGKWLASASHDGARVWNVATGNCLCVLRGQSWVNRVAFSPDGKRLATAGSQGTKVWDVATRRELYDLHVQGAWASSAQFSPDGRLLITGDVQRLVKVWDAATGRELRALKGHANVIHTVAFSPDGRRLASASIDGTVRLWDTASGQELLVLRGHTGGVHSVAFAPDGRRLASAGPDGTARIWDALSGQELANLHGHAGAVFCVTFSPDGRRLATTGPDATVRVWDLGVAAPSAVKLSSAEVEALWADLGNDHAGRAFHATLTLAAAPAQTVPYFKAQLRPVPASAADTAHLTRLIAALDDRRFPVRQRATEELEDRGKIAEPALRTALEQPASLEARRRLNLLLQRLEAASPTREQLLAERSAEVLERIGSAEARDLLTSLAGGAPGAWLTQESRAALARLDRQSARRP